MVTDTWEATAASIARLRIQENGGPLLNWGPFQKTLLEQCFLSLPRRRIRYKMVPGGMPQWICCSGNVREVADGAVLMDEQAVMPELHADPWKGTGPGVS